MGVLIPEDFPLELAKDATERLVLQTLRDRLTDGWLIIPNVGLVGRRDREMDIVLVHEREGIALIEVKGHRPSLRKGVWHDAHGQMNPQPDNQARDNAYELRDKLRKEVAGAEHISVEYGVIFPNATEIKGQLPTDLFAEQVLTEHHLIDPQDAIELLLARRFSTNLGYEVVEGIVKLLCPDVDFVWDPEARAQLTRSRLEQICGQHVRVLERLDANRRAIVTGAAGTGKSRLAMAWARRALMRRERVCSRATTTRWAAR